MLFSVQNDLIYGIISKREVEENYKSFPKDLVLISIIDPDQPLLSDEILSHFEDSISLQFWDLEEKFASYDIIRQDQASHLRYFIQKNKDKRFLIHCMAGISRSAGIGCAVECLIEYNGDDYLYKTSYSDVKNHQRYSPNWKVYDLIINGSKND